MKLKPIALGIAFGTVWGGSLFITTSIPAESRISFR